MYNHNQPAGEPAPQSNEADAAADSSWDKRASLGLALGGAALFATGVAVTILFGAPEAGILIAGTGVAAEAVAGKIALFGPDI